MTEWQKLQNDKMTKKWQKMTKITKMTKKKDVQKEFHKKIYQKLSKNQ